MAASKRPGKAARVMARLQMDAENRRNTLTVTPELKRAAYRMTEIQVRPSWYPQEELRSILADAQLLARAILDEQE